MIEYSFMSSLLNITLLMSIFLSIFCLVKLQYTIKTTLKKDKSTDISLLISEGLLTYSKRVLSSTLQITLYVTVLLFILSIVFNKGFSWLQIGAFIIGAVTMSLIAFCIQYFGPKLLPSIIYSSQTYLENALSYLFSSCFLLGLLSFSLITSGIFTCIIFFKINSIIGFGLGISLSSFFLRIGGGLYKTGSDIGAKRASKIESSLPDFDRRNPGTLVDMIGSFVGYMIGYGTDILSSFIFAFIACLLIPYALYHSAKISFDVYQTLFFIPIFILLVGFITTLLTFLFARLLLMKKRYSNYLLECLYFSVIISGVILFIIFQYTSIPLLIIPLWFSQYKIALFPPYFIGLIGAALIGFTSEFMTSSRFKPARSIATEAEFGSELSVINANATSLKNNGLFLIIIIFILVSSFHFAGFFGISLATMGMLSLTCLIFIVKLFHPLARNAMKVATLSEYSHTAIQHLHRLNSIGTTTIALGNGFVSAAAILSTISLLFSLCLFGDLDLSYLLLIDTFLLVGILTGGTLPFIFSGFLLTGLRKAVLNSITEISRQFKEIPYLYEDKAKPDVIKASDKQSCIAMDSLIIPGILMAAVPIIVGYGLGERFLFGIVLGTFLSGFNQGYFWSNLGDSLYQAKHVIEGGYYGGKESVLFSNIETAGNIGAFYKDLLGPSITILIKSVTIISMLVFLLLSLP